MKKLTAGILTAATVLCIGATSAYAIGWGHGDGGNFIDENSDGICDYRSSDNGCALNQGQNFTDDNNDGICDYHSSDNGCALNQGQNFTDDNDDGICDYRSSDNECTLNQGQTNAGQRHHNGRRQGHHGRHGRG